MMIYNTLYCQFNPQKHNQHFFKTRVCPLIEGNKYFTALKLVSNFKVHIEFCLYIIHKSSIKAVQ